MAGDARANIRRKMWVYRTILIPLTISIPVLRKASQYGSPPFHTSQETQWQPFTANGVPVEWLIPSSAPDSSAILYLHGGGGVVGLTDSERWLAAHLSKACQLRSLLPEYRLAPEHPFPAGLEDCLAVYQWLLSNGYPAHEIVVAGISAGGLLTITLLLAIREANLPYPAVAICLSPNTDPSCSGASVQKNRYRDALLSPRYLRTMMKLYAGSHDLNDPLLTPLTADLHGLPPVLIQVGEDELLLDDSLRFSDRLQAAGGNITLEIYPHMWHGWHTCGPVLEEANQAVEHIALFASQILAE